MKGLEDELFGFDSKSNITTFTANTSRKGKTVDFFEDDDGDAFVNPTTNTPTTKKADPYFQDTKPAAAKPKSKGMLYRVLSWANC
jgi:hypothetical protein